MDATMQLRLDDCDDSSKRTLADFGIPISGRLEKHSAKEEPISIKMKQHLCAKHALPKTNLTNVILNSNVSQKRQLDMVLTALCSRRERLASVFDLNRRSFIQQQNKKQKKWKKDDDYRLNAFNLPAFPYKPDERPDSADALYQTPSYESNVKRSARPKAVLPKMQLQKEQTEIISYREKTFMSKLPAVEKIDETALRRYNTFCGVELQRPSVPCGDQRFRHLENSLSVTNKSCDISPNMNSFSRSKVPRYSTKSPTRRLDSLGSSIHRVAQSAKVMTASSSLIKDLSQSVGVSRSIHTVSGTRQNVDNQDEQL